MFKLNDRIRIKSHTLTKRLEGLTGTIINFELEDSTKWLTIKLDKNLENGSPMLYYFCPDFVEKLSNSELFILNSGSQRR